MLDTTKCPDGYLPTQLAGDFDPQNIAFFIPSGDGEVALLKVPGLLRSLLKGVKNGDVQRFLQTLLRGGSSNAAKAFDLPQALRVMQYSENYQGASLKDTIARIAGPNPVVSSTPGKILYTNPDTGLQVIQDTRQAYFRVADSTAETSPDRYLDLSGNRIPLNVHVFRADGSTIMSGLPSDVREALTHFWNTDEGR